MPTPPIENDALLRTVEARQASKNNVEAAAALGVDEKTVRRHMRLAAERGILGTEPVLPGYAIKSIASKQGDAWVKQTREHGEVFQVPDGHTAKGYSALVDADGRVIQQWVKTRETPSAVDIADILAKRFEAYTPASPAVLKSTSGDSDIHNLIPCNDWHVGMFSWARETDQNWDLKIGPRVIGDAIDEAIARSPSAHTAIVLGGGDLTHADNNDNRTKRSGNVLDVDGRHQKVVETAGELMVRTVDAALHKHDRVKVRNLKGNHDDETAPAIAWFLKAWYRNEPRVDVDVDQSLFFYHEHGLTMLGATHGHAAKLRDMPQIMATRRAEMWGRTRYRYAHGFHVHHKSGFVTEQGGVVCESHQAPIPQDAWHYGAGFLSGRSIQTISYHKSYGEFSRVRVAILDGAPSAANDNRKAEERAA
ncbi:hypothetical protein KW403_12400 [Nitratireductor kimnyeongensis]|nr:hypothetical protein KW403_12400 [Nitratireductor kimnyeongensis]